MYMRIIIVCSGVRLISSSMNEKRPDDQCRRALLFSTFFNVAASGGK